MPLLLFNQRFFLFISSYCEDCDSLTPPCSLQVPDEEAVGKHRGRLRSLKKLFGSTKDLFGSKKDLSGSSKDLSGSRKDLSGRRDSIPTAGRPAPPPSAGAAEGPNVWAQVGDDLLRHLC